VEDLIGRLASFFFPRTNTISFT